MFFVFSKANDNRRELEYCSYGHTYQSSRLTGYILLLLRSVEHDIKLKPIIVAAHLNTTHLNSLS